MPKKLKLITRIACPDEDSIVELAIARNKVLRVESQKRSLTTGKVSRHSIYFDADQAAWLFAQLANLLPLMEKQS